MIFSENVGETETVISASGISKQIEVDILIFTTRSPTNDLNLKIIKKNKLNPSLKSQRDKYIKKRIFVLPQPAL